MAFVRLRISAKAAASVLVSTATRMMSAPASTRCSIWATVVSTSAVFVAHMLCTAIGWPAPTVSEPICTGRVGLRGAGAIYDAFGAGGLQFTYFMRFAINREMTLRDFAVRALAKEGMIQIGEKMLTLPIKQTLTIASLGLPWNRPLQQRSQSAFCSCKSL